MANSVGIAIDLELTEPVSGTVSSEVGEPVRFSGWLQLHSALESIREAAGPTAAAPGPAEDEQSSALP